MSPTLENGGTTPRLLVVTLLALLTIQTAGCATVPREAAALSNDLGHRIDACHHTHVALIHLYMESRRQVVERFLEENWLPTFAGALFDKPAIREAWNQVVQTPDASARVEFIKGLGPLLVAQIEEKRRQFLAPLEELERLAVRQADTDYGRMLQENASITGLLASASRLHDPQLARVERAQEAATRALTDDADHLVRLLTESTDAVEQNGPKIRALLDGHSN